MKKSIVKIDERSKISQSPGVYLFLASKKGVFKDTLKGTQRTVLYVGKATNLRSRVASYFTGKDSRGERIFKMVGQAKWIETIETETVLEAVILEANLIKKYLPKYNVDLKDDKSFSYFAVTKEKFPRVIIVRETDLQKMSSSGLTRGSGKLRGVADNLDSRLRGNDRGESGNDRREGGNDKKEGKNNTGKFRDDKKVDARRYVRTYARTYGPYTSKRHMETVLKILRKIFPFHSGVQGTEKGCLYRQIGLCPGPYDGGVTKEDYKKNIRNIEYVLRGQKKRLLSTLEREMKAVAKNEDFEHAKKLRDQVFALKHVRDIALLTDDRRQTSDDGEQVRIEAYDISNISGEHAVASMVVFVGGEPKKSEYRKFKIQSVKGANDVAMMREVLARRMRHSEWTRPNMIVLDGGKGHLNMAEKLWEALGVSVSILGVAKGPTRKKVDLYPSKKFPPPEKLLKDKLLLEYLREEAHRFAITYHRKLRGKGFIKSV